jgi:hypothetical protein
LDDGQEISQNQYLKYPFAISVILPSLIHSRLLGEKLNYKKKEDWYAINGSDFIANSGRSILLIHENAPNAVMRIFGDHDWNSWEFSNLKLPDGYWRVEANRDAYFEYHLMVL